MRSGKKGTLLLIELSIMILVASVACAFSLQAFSQARRISKETELRDLAYMEAQNCAEEFYACNGVTEGYTEQSGELYVKLTVTRDGKATFGQVTVTDEGGRIWAELRLLAQGEAGYD